MWLAWRIVQFADAESDGLAPKPTEDDAAETEPQPRRAIGLARRVGIAIAVLAMVVGLGGIVFFVWRVLGG